MNLSYKSQKKDLKILYYKKDKIFSFLKNYICLYYSKLNPIFSIYQTQLTSIALL